MSVAEKFSIVVLVLSWGAQIFRRSLFSRCIKPIFVFSVFGSFCSAVYSAFLQYYAWKGNKFSVLFLPPYRDWSYFLSYVGFRIFSPILVSLFFALVFKFVCEFLNRRYEERFFEPEEGWLFAFGIFMAGYPGFLFYIPLMLVVGLFASLFYNFLGKGRAPLFYAWLPVAIFAILLKSSIPQSALNFLII